jgi:Pentapeptide repeats (8 copies)
MDELDQVKAIAGSLIEKAKLENSSDSVAILEKAMAALKTVSETEKVRAEAKKLLLEEKKLAYDIELAPKRDKSEARKASISLLTPIITTAILALTLILQTYQFTHSEKNKREAAEDAQWSDAVKALSQSSNLSQPAVILSPFLKSRRYADLAKQTALQLLTKTGDSQVFKDLFRSTFEPVDWRNLPKILDVDRSMSSKFNELATLTWDPVKEINDLTKLKPEDKERYGQLIDAIIFVSSSVAPLLQAARPQGEVLDLRSTLIENSDWKGVDLSGANLDYSSIIRVNLQGASLREIKQFDGSIFYQTAWWEAVSISPPLLDYLIQKWLYNPKQKYGSNSRLVPQQEYDVAISRLKQSVGK